MSLPDIPIDFIVSGYRDTMSWLHGATARNIVVIVPPLKSGCPNDIGWDAINKRSFNVYNSGNAFSPTVPTIIPSLNISGILNIPFSGGQNCPVCNGHGQISSPTSGNVSARVKWVDEDTTYAFRGEKLQVPEFDVRVKVTGLADIALLDRCTNVIIDGILCRPQQARINVGLRDVHTYVYHFNKAV